MTELEKEMLEALESFTEMYVELINSGDCGNWNPEGQEEVKLSRAVIAKAKAKGQQKC